MGLASHPVGESPDDALADELLATLKHLLATRRLTEHQRRALGGATWHQRSVLATLIEWSPIRMSDLAARLNVSAPSTTVAVNRLVRLGFVLRLRDERDERTVLVDITETGRCEYRESVAAARAVLEHRLSSLTAADRIALQRAVPVLDRLADD